MQLQILLSQLLSAGGTALVAYATPGASDAAAGAVIEAALPVAADGGADYGWVAHPTFQLVTLLQRPGFTLVHLRRQSV